MTTEQHKDTNLLDRIKQTVSRDASQLRQMAFVGKTHKQVMNDLLEQVQKVDFRERAGFEPDDENAKLKKPHYLIITIEELLDLASRNKWGLCRREGFFYSYNGAFWKPLEKDDLKAFLRQVAERMGVDKFTARYVEFSKDLFEQFTETAYLPAPDGSPDAVKINLQNGTFEISTNSQHLRPPDAADFLTHQLPFAYDPAATAPQFEQFLNRVQPDPDCQKASSGSLHRLW